jgi:hypothetical protein
MPPNIIRVDPSVSRYRFDSLQHGDAIEVNSKPGAQEMFRRWKKASGRRGRLVPSRDFPRLLFFIDEQIV